MANTQSVTYQEFFSQVLSDLGIKPTPGALAALATVTVIEGTNNRYNPLNSVVPYGTSTSFNSVGVQDYQNYPQGVAGTVKLLKQDNWTAVRNALATGSYGSVLTAFANMYASWGSHPSFTSISASQDSALLSQSLGSANASDIQGVVAVQWATAGHWTTYTGKPLRDPPAGTFTYGKPTGTTVGNQSGDRATAFAPSLDDGVWAWMLAYFDDGSLKKKWGSSRPDHASLINEYNALLSDQRKSANNETAQPDPGRTVAGIGVNVGSWATGLTALLAWITNVKNWERIGLFVLGGSILIFAAIELFGKSAENALPPIVPV